MVIDDGDDDDLFVFLFTMAKAPLISIDENKIVF